MRLPMSRIRLVTVALFVFLPGLFFVSGISADDSYGGQVFLHTGWRMESSEKASAGGEAISRAGFDDSKWHPALVPGTVVGSLVADKTLPDPNYGENLKSFPGAFNDNKHQAANLEMPADSPFRCPYWFRTEFETPSAYANRL